MHFAESFFVLAHVASIQSSSQISNIFNNNLSGVCICVTSGSCTESNWPGNNDGTETIDTRIITVSLSFKLIVSMLTEGNEVDYSKA